MSAKSDKRTFKVVLTSTPVVTDSYRGYHQLFIFHSLLESALRSRAEINYFDETFHSPPGIFFFGVISGHFPFSYVRVNGEDVLILLEISPH